MEYIDKSVALATDTVFRNHCREQLIERSEVLYCNTGFIRDFERAIEDMLGPVIELQSEAS